MPDWNEDSPELRRNLARLLEEIAQSAEHRQAPTIELARSWQRRFMEGLEANPKYVGAFRGEPGLEKTRVRVGRRYGTSPERVAEEL